MPEDVLDRLRPLDPAAGLEPEPSDAVLARLVDEPRATASRPSQVPRRAGAALAGTAIAAATIAGVSLVTGGSPAPDLAARAYAQTSTAEAVLFVRVQSELESFGDPSNDSERPSSGGTSTTRATVEQWTRGKLSHTILTIPVKGGGRPSVSDQVVGVDGVLEIRGNDGVTSRITPGSAPDADTMIASSNTSLVEDFRKRYERGQLDEGGPVTFRGRRAVRYVYSTRREVPAVPKYRIPAATYVGSAEYFLDAETGAPLGATERDTTLRSDGLKAGTVKTEVIESIERLEPGPENLALLRFAP